MALAGGIDLGGTKIDARLFDPEVGWSIVDARELPTPRDTYEHLLDALADQVRWLTGKGANTIGLGAPGLVFPDGRVLTANLPASGRLLLPDLTSKSQAPVRLVNDCRAFALSEAVLGAGRGASNVLGLVVGTGLAGGLVSGGRLVDGPNGQAGEFGHAPVAHEVMLRHDLPVVSCGCGRTGCYETLCSGPGIARLARHLEEVDATALQLSGRRDTAASRVLEVWADVMTELLVSLILTADPDVIVFGGGVSKMAGFIDRLAAALAPKMLAGTIIPALRLAEGGDRSGARGAALLARDAL